MIKFENNFVVTTKTKLFVYRDANHKHEAQKPKALEIN